MSVLRQGFEANIQSYGELGASDDDGEHFKVHRELAQYFIFRVEVHNHSTCTPLLANNNSPLNLEREGEACDEHVFWTTTKQAYDFEAVQPPQVSLYPPRTRMLLRHRPLPRGVSNGEAFAVVSEAVDSVPQQWPGEHANLHAANLHAATQQSYRFRARKSYPFILKLPHSARTWSINAHNSSTLPAQSDPIAAPVFSFKPSDAYDSQPWMKTLIIKTVLASDKMFPDANFIEMSQVHYNGNDPAEHTTVGFFIDSDRNIMLGRTRQHIYASYSAEEIEEAKIEYLRSNISSTT